MAFEETFPWLSLVVKVLELIFLCVISTTMANFNGSLLWIVNIGSVLPQLFSTFLIIRFMRDDNDTTRGCLPIACFIEVGCACLYLAEVFMIGLGEMYSSYLGGKVTAQVFSVVFVVYWAVSFRLTTSYNYRNMPEEKQRQLRQRHAMTTKKESLAPVP